MYQEIEEHNVYYLFYEPPRRQAKISRQVISKQLSKPAILGVKYTCRTR